MHFRQRRTNRYPQGTFEWSNIFGSYDSCGKFKDKLPIYRNTDVIKADEEYPEAFLSFLPDGNVAPAKNLNPDDKIRAEETIRIFNLYGSLRQIRESAIKGYLQTAEWLPIVEGELNSIKNLPFATAIKHLLLPTDL